MNGRVVKKKVRIDLYDVFALKGDIAGQFALGEKERELFQEVINDIPENAVPFVEEKMYRPTGLEMIFEITVRWEEKRKRTTVRKRRIVGEKEDEENTENDSGNTGRFYACWMQEMHQYRNICGTGKSC